MSRISGQKDMNLKALELFQICASKGSLQAVSHDTGLSISTVSHHLRGLEEHLGVALFDHSRRPMKLTPKGHIFLRSINTALHSIRKAKAEVSVGTIAESSYLRLGAIEDFDSDIIPELAVYLSMSMPRCDFMYHTDSSYQIIEMLRDRKLDLGIASSPTERMRDLQDRPLLRDPFVVALPQGYDISAADFLEDRNKLPFLRFSDDTIIGRQIESQLRRMGLSLPHRFECSNSQTLMAMVAAGTGWTIITPLIFSRGKHFLSQLQIHRFPGKSFARTLAVVATPDCSGLVLDLVDKKMRTLITEHAINPIHKNSPWLADSFTLIN